MKNLITVAEDWTYQEALEDDSVTAFAADHETKTNFFATRGGTINISAADDQAQRSVSLTSFSEDGSPPSLEPGAEVIALEWLPEHEALAVASSYGDLVLVHVMELQLEAVGNLEGGIAGMAWAPDGEVVAIATGAGKLLLMTKDWDVLAEVDLDVPTPSDRPAPDAVSDTGRVSISWRGDGKYLVTNAAGSVVVWEREGCVLHARAETVPGLQSHVAWQPCGALIAAVQSGQPGATCPTVVLFERNGLRKGGFEIESAPSDAIVRGMQWNASSELLGIALQWGEVAAVQVWYRSNYHWYLKREWRRTVTSVGGTFNFAWDPELPLRLQLWTARGAHSHLDLGWQSAVTAHNCTALVIDGPRVRITPLLETLIPPPLCAAAVRFPAPVQAACLGADESGEGEVLAAVLSDGRIGLAHCPKTGRWEELDAREEGESGEPVLEGQVLDGEKIEDRLLCWGREPLTLLAIESDGTGNSKQERRDAVTVNESVTVFRLQRQADDSEIGNRYGVKSKGVVSLPGRVLSGWPAPNAKSDLVLLKGGHSYTLDSGEPPKRSVTVPEEGVTRVEVVETGLGSVVLCLASGKLYLGDQRVATGVTSFVMRGGQSRVSQPGAASETAYVIWTSQKDELHIAELGDGSLNKPRVMSLNEKGAVLLTALGEEAGVLLQTPRGNLEALYPRELVLLSAAQFLQNCEYAEALEVCRRHRLDLNLMVDYGGWEQFVRNTSAFVRAVGSPAKVAELVTSLHGGDVTSQAYQGLLPPWKEEIVQPTAATSAVTSVATSAATSAPAQSNGSRVQGTNKGKVTAVCTAIREALREGTAGNLAGGSVGLCILATHARSDPPELEEALRMLKELRKAELQKDPNAALASLAPVDGAEDPDDEGAPLISDAAPLTADRAMRHLIWLCGDANALYDVALGMYDLELAAMVAAQAQMDPKEFLPYLQNLASLSPALRKYTIDRKLARWESALRHLAQAGDGHLSTCLALLSQHPDLYPLAVGTIFLDQPLIRRAIFEAWGDHLLAKEQFEQAAVAFLTGGFLDRALGAYRTGGAWKAMFRVAGRLGYDVSMTKELASQVVEELQALGRPGDAGHVALEYLSDVDLGVRLLCEAGEWSEAVRVAYAMGKAELVDDVIRSAAVTSAKAHVGDLQEGQEKVGKYLARFQAVRQRRLQLAVTVGATGGDGFDDDGASVATTATSTAMSGFSAYSHGTGQVESSVGTSVTRKRLSKRAKKKQQQGGGKIRAGSPEEETALVTHIASLRASEPVTVEIRQLAETLVLLGEEPLARQLRSKFVSFCKTQEEGLLEARMAQEEDKAAAGEEVERRRAAAASGAPEDDVGTGALKRSFVGDHNVVKWNGRLDFRTKGNTLENGHLQNNGEYSSGVWEVLGT